MGLADFLATAGQGKTLGHVAEAFGGQTTQQKAVDDFINNQLPALADQIHKAGTKEDLARAGQSMITSGLKAGINPQGLDKLMEMTIQPALRNMQSGELDKLRTDYGAQPAQPAQPRPQGTEGPLTPSGNFIDPKAATPERPLDLNFMMRFGQATGPNPEQYNKMLETPATIAGKAASTQHTQTQIDKEQATEKQIQGLPSTPRSPGEPSQQDVARVPGLAQFLEARGKPEDPLLEERRNLLNAQAIKAAQGPASGGVSPYQQFNEAARMRTEFQNQSAPFQKVRDSFNRIQASATNPSPAGDLSMVYNYMKMLDPGSVVRESEFASAAAAKPMLERLGLSWDAVGSVWSGKKLTPGQRQDFLNRANQLYQTEAKQHEQRVSETRRMATGFGINPDLIISDMGAQPAPAASAGQGGYSGGQPSGSGSGSGQGGGGAMDTLPPAKDHPGKIVRDTKTGQRMKSDGAKWVAIN